MNKLKIFLRMAVVSLAMFFQLQFVKFFFVDSCLDRGGRFLYDELMCEGEKGFISFNLAPVFYILTCILFGLVALGMLKLMERLIKKL
ncbi:MAG: hypothetical protein AABY53_02175 [Bdellovibrionota bacterium]